MFDLVMVLSQFGKHTLAGSKLDRKTTRVHHVLQMMETRTCLRSWRLRKSAVL